jgi:predicted nucleic acid-binding protein
MGPYKVSKSINFDKPIIEAKYYHETLFVVTNTNELYTLDHNYVLKTKTKLLKNQPERHTYCNAYSIASSGISVPSDKILFCVCCVDGKVVPKFQKKIHDLEIVYTRHSQSGEYLVSAGNDGKVFVIDTTTKAIRYTLPKKSDYCSYANFSHFKIFLFVGYFNGENVLLNLTNDKIYSFKTDYPIECAKFFDDDKKLFLCDREGNSIIFDCMTFEIISKKVLFNEWISCVVLSQNKKFIIAGSRKNKLYLIDPYSNEIVRVVELEDEGMTSISIYDSYLLLSFANSTIKTIDLNYKKDDFSVHMNLKEYEKVKAVLDSNVFLYIDDDILKFKGAFEEVIQKAKELISKGRINEAVYKVAPFMEYKEFKHRIDLLFMQQDHIAKFIEAVDEKRIAEAYEMAQKYSVIHGLSYYDGLEKQWALSFAQARKIIEEDPLRGKAKAEELLSVYSKIPQKVELVKQLINNTARFIQAEMLIKKQEFVTYFNLVNSYTFLKDTVLYKKVESLAQSLYSKALLQYSNREYTLAKDTLLQLLNFPYYKGVAQKELNKINALIELESAISRDDKKRVYALLQQVECIGFVDSFIQYNQTFETLIQSALHRAQSGKIDEAVYALRNYIELPGLRSKIDNCMKLGYLCELKSADIDKKEVEIIIGKYKALFGLDDELKSIFIQKGYELEYNIFSKSTKAIPVKRYPASLLY